MLTANRHRRPSKIGEPDNELFINTGTTNVLSLDGHVEGVNRNKLPNLSRPGPLQISVLRTKL